MNQQHRGICPEHKLNEKGKPRAARVLLADTDAGLLASCRTHLSNSEFEVAIARNGLDCLEQMRRFRPDILVLEPELPWGWGEGVVAMMQEGTDVPEVPVIVMTAHSDAPSVARLSQYPIEEYLFKPVAPATLAARIREVLERVCCS